MAESNQGDKPQYKYVDVAALWLGEYNGEKKVSGKFSDSSGPLAGVRCYFQKNKSQREGKRDPDYRIQVKREDLETALASFLAAHGGVAAASETGPAGEGENAEDLPF